jgi:hypothetical protein
MNRQATEIDVLQNLTPELEAEGYEVYLHPNRHLLPEFFGNFMPDAIARRPDKGIAIEVIQDSRDAKRRKEKFAKLFEGQDEWEFRVVWIRPAGPVIVLEQQTLWLIQKRTSEIKALAENKNFGPAFLLAWATFEAIGRILLPQEFERPQTPGRLIQVLAGEGYITPNEADTLRVLAEKRNKLIHGELKTRISESDVTQMVDVVSMLTKMAGKAPVE